MQRRIINRLYRDNSALYYLCQGYANGSKDFFNAKQREGIIEKFGNIDVVAEFYNENYSDEYYDHGVERTVSRTNLAELIDDAQYSSYFCYSDLENTNTLKDLFLTLQELLDHDLGCRISTVEVFNKREQEQKRTELENYVANFAWSHKVKPGSMEFLSVLEDSVQRNRNEREYHNGYEAKAEHFAACMYSGAGEDVYYRDMNYTNGQLGSELEKLNEALGWIQDNCPLLWCQYLESKNEAE